MGSHKSADDGFRHTWEVGLVPVCDKVVSDVSRIRHISEEVGMLLHSRDPKC